MILLRKDLPLQDYRELKGIYDHIVSIEMFEALGEGYWKKFFRILHSLLKPGGKMIIQSITINNRDFSSYRKCSDFIQQYIFPGGMLPSPEIFISTAAVADYRPVNTHDKKIKKTETLKSIKLQKNPDILTAVANLENPPFTLGFAAETDNLESNAKEKLLSKNLNMIAANKIGEEGHGIASSTNAIELYWSGGHETLPLTDKGRLARQLVNILAKHYQLSKSNVIKMGHAKGSIKNP